MKMRKKFLALLLSMTMSLAVATTGCGGDSGSGSVPPDQSAPTSTTPADGGEVVVMGVPSTWNQLICVNPSSAYHVEVAGMIFDRLIRTNEAGVNEPRAAASWESSEDLKTLTLHLREDSYWHDGEQVTAEDWLFTFQLMTSEDGSQCVTQNMYVAIEGTDEKGLLVSGETLGVESPDEFTLVLHFKEPMNADAFFYKYANFIYVLPEHLLADLDANDILNWDFWKAPIGSGPCKFVSDDSGMELVMEAVDNYPVGELQFDKLIYRVVTSDAAITSLQAGEINGYVYGYTRNDLAPIENNPNLRADLMDGVSSFTGLAINNERFDVNFRKALNLAVDKELIVQSQYNGDGVATNTSLRQNSEYCINTWTGRDVEAAKAYLAQSSSDINKTYTLACSSGRGETTAAILLQNLAEIGINIEIVTVDTAVVLSGMTDGTYDMGIVNYTSGSTPTWLTSTNLFGLNVGHIENAEQYLAYADQVGVSSSAEETAELAKEYQALFDENMPYIPLVHTYGWYIFSSWLSNVSAVETTACWEWQISK